ncbi:MAG: bacillithiol biosynthesis deacetylase BshB1 [Bacteroidota bacterium]|nr:bacillithiol biosynthesis deacetylase BshB1 [Bacteroidota bacterium]MDP4234654.1 bacillithiol biosynthesis deacetylase BshB1 [Bacteroidota bacterium]MDP4243819.1 bacillithiol biosynthesis deacetylase BshB1 [Bacteroidota bacterium]MDP4288590.1 bacillithiol biosynthesis deacetylase BshB1 [Bacteroidota bacterium]
MQPIDLLAIAAHPDDAEIGCGGTLLLAKRDGKRTGIVDLTRGELSTRGTLESRAKETEAASRVLGLDYRKNLGMPDGNIELSRDNVATLVAEIRKTRPTIVLAPPPKERHPDHEAASELAHRACFYSGLAKYPVDGEPHRPLLVLNYIQTYSLEPRIIVDVSEVFEDRMRAIEAYGTQFGGKDAKPVDQSLVPEPETFLSQGGFVDWLRARSGAWGLMIGAKYGEAFSSPEPLGTKDLFNLVTKTIA